MNHFENSLNPKKMSSRIHSLFFVSMLITYSITILMLFISLKTLVKREPLNTASLDAGYKLISVY